MFSYLNSSSICSASLKLTALREQSWFVYSEDTTRHKNTSKAYSWWELSTQLIFQTFAVHNVDKH